MTTKPETGLLMLRKFDEMIALLKAIHAKLGRIEQDMATEWLRAVNRADYWDYMVEESDNAADRLSGVRSQQQGNDKGSA